MRTREEIAENPQIGDKLFNTTWVGGHKTRRVYDRTLGGDVCYVWDTPRMYKGQCTLAEWREFAQKSLVKQTSLVKKVPKP